MLATEPMMVRLPANVVANASTFHIKTGSAKRAIHFPATSTNGTFEKMFDPATENQVRFQVCAVTCDPEDRLQIPINRIRQTGVAESIDNDEQGRKKYQQMPIDKLEHLMRIAACKHHDERRT